MQECGWNGRDISRTDLLGHEEDGPWYLLILLGMAGNGVVVLWAGKFILLVSQEAEEVEWWRRHHFQCSGESPWLKRDGELGRGCAPGLWRV